MKLDDQLSPVRRWSRACVALPTCSQAVTESERAMPAVLDQLEVELAKLGLARRAFRPPHDRLRQRLRRPYNADIGLVGRAAGRYAIYVGGHRLGNRLGFLYQEGVPLERIVPTLVPLLARFKQLRQAGESFGDFCHRTGHDALVTDNGG